MKITNMMALCLSLSLAAAPMSIADTKETPQETEQQKTPVQAPEADEDEQVDEKESEEDVLDSIIDEAEKAKSKLKLKYKYEIVLSDDYEFPENIESENGNRHIQRFDDPEDVHYTGFVKDTNGTQPVNTMMVEYAKEVYKALKDKKKVQAHLEKAALVGFKSKSGTYVGPLQLCLMEAEDTLQYDNRDLDRKVLYGFYNSFMKDNKMKADSGDYEGNFKYRTSIEWKKGLPYKVKCTVDFTPCKSKLSAKE